MGRFATLCVGLLWLLSCDLTSQPRPAGPTGQQTSPLIGGVPDTRHPAIGALLSNLSIYCTGTLLTPRLVLTAAHCIESASRQQTLGARLQFRVDIPTKDTFQARYYDVTSMFIHPQYSGSNAASKNQSDVGVVFLAQEVPDVTPLPLYTQGLNSGWIGRKISFWGYGLLQTLPQRKSASKKHYLALTLREVQADRFQVPDKGKSICSGDSGGPALYEIDGVLRIIGVKSYVQGGRQGNQPLCDGSGFAFRTDAYFSWLLPYMAQTGWKCSGETDCSTCGSCQAGKCTPKPLTNAPTLCQPCQADGDCGSGICAATPDGKRCTQPCKSGCCPQGYSCQFLGQGVKQCFPSTGHCAPITCQTDAQCGPGEGCSGGTCKPKVIQPAVYRCRKCSQDGDCQGGRCRTFPDGERCLQPCEGGVFCPQGDTCRAVEGMRMCVPSSGQCACVSSRDCHDGYLCRDGLCQRGEGGKHGASCDDDNPCAKEHLCLGVGEGTCVAICPGTYPPGVPGSLCDAKTCLHHSRCYGVSGQSVCLLSCQDNGDCAFGGSCRKISGLSLCTCDKDSDCKTGAGCNKETVGSFGVCAPRSAGGGCPTGTSCQRSVANTNLCQADDALQTGRSCANGESCQWGLRCINRSDGPICARDCSRDGTCQPEGGRCTQVPGALLCFCQDDKACLEGFICQRGKGDNEGVCVSAQCQRDADCKAPQRCQTGRCQAPTPETTEPEPTPQEPTPDAGPADTTPERPDKGCGCTSSDTPWPTGSLWWLWLLGSMLWGSGGRRQRQDE